VQLKIRTTLFTILDYNPSFSDEHWLNDINREAKTYHFITTYKDNPFLEQNVIDELESLQWKNPSLWQVFGLGQRAMVEGLVFNNFTVEKKLPELKKQWIGIDFGFTQDPTAIVLVGVIDDTLYIHELAYERKMLSKDIAQVVCKSKYKHLPIICDSADPRLRKEIVNVAREEFKTDIDIIPVKKGNTGSIMPSIDKMSMYKIKITETSFNVIREFKNYTYVKDREGNWINRPIVKFNHAIDAIRYVVMTKLLGGYKKRGLKITR
jgi:phage terminase large subunit